jgi:SAM-dependent methyltransferase
MLHLSQPRFRVDFARRMHRSQDDRPPDRLLAHYVLERQLSDRLRRAPRELRSLLYTKVYRELFASLPDHPQCRAKQPRFESVRTQWQRVMKQIRPEFVFMEVGCGDAALAFAAARHVRTVYGVDVTDTLIDIAMAPPNFAFLRTNGIEIPLEAEKVDFVYSNQLMEHLHPEDAADQLREIHRVLKPGGRYMCITPSKMTGPHDISCYFDYEATCLHLKEYDYGSLRQLFRKSGFRTFGCRVFVRGWELHLPYVAMRTFEYSLSALPPRIRVALTDPSLVQAIMGLNVIAEK